MIYPGFGLRVSRTNPVCDRFAPDWAMTSIPAILELLFREYDIDCSAGAIEYQTTRNLLATLNEQLDHVSGFPLMKTTIFQPCGFGYHERLRGHLQVPREEVIDEKMILWSSTQQSPPPLGQQVWLLEVKECDFLDSSLLLGYEFSETSHWMLAPKPTFEDKFRICEMFAGSFAGWKQATHFLERTGLISAQTVALEHDMDTAAAYALSHSANFVPNPAHLPPSVFVHSQDDWIICTDVGNQVVLDAIAQWQPQLLTMSPPCQPWSGAGQQDGLFRSDGMTLAEILFKIRFLRVPMLLLEEVPGFCKHPHFQAVQDIMHWIGYRCVWNKVMNLNDLARVSRPRWLALYVHFGECLPSTIHQGWTRIDRTLLRSPIMFLSNEDREALKLCDRAFALASDSQYLGGPDRRFPPGLTTDSVLNLRTYQGQGEIPCFLARYGTQHELSPDLLRTKGYHAHFVKDTALPEARRYWHPAEIAIAHGITQPIFLDNKHTQAWTSLGNMISVQHALVVLTNAIRKYVPEIPTTHAILNLFREKQFKAAEIDMTPLIHGYMLGPVDMSLSMEFQIAANQIPQALSITDPDQFWHPKHGLSVWELPSNHLSTQTISLLTPESVESTQLDLEVAHPFVKGCVCFETHLTPFWVSGDMNSCVLESVWEQHFAARFPGLGAETPVELHPSPIPRQPETSKECVLILDDGHLSLVKCLDQALTDMETLHSIAPKLFDQFGDLTQGQRPAAHTILFKEPLPQVDVKTLSLNMHSVLQAFTQVSVTWNWDIRTDVMTCDIHGSLEFCRAIGSFWKAIFTHEHEQILGRKLCIHPDHDKIAFEPMPNRGVCPALPCNQCSVFRHPECAWISCKHSSNLMKSSQQSFWNGLDEHSGKVPCQKVSLSPFYMRCYWKHCHRSKLMESFSDAMVRSWIWHRHLPHLTGTQIGKLSWSMLNDRKVCAWLEAEFNLVPNNSKNRHTKQHLQLQCWNMDILCQL